MFLSIPGLRSNKIRRDRHMPRTSPIVVRTAPGRRSRGILSFGPLRISCALGRGGTVAFKCEGDGGTPATTMGVIGGYYNAKRSSPYPARITMVPATARTGWCDAVENGNYNRPVRLPFGASHETLIRTDELYDICLVLDWNVTHRRRNAGSAIFLHIARAGYTPTEGCIAISKRDMALLLPHIRPGTPVIVVR